MQLEIRGVHQTRDEPSHGLVADQFAHTSWLIGWLVGRSDKRLVFELGEELASTSLKLTKNRCSLFSNLQTRETTKFNLNLEVEPDPLPLLLLSTLLLLFLFFFGAASSRRLCKRDHATNE